MKLEASQSIQETTLTSDISYKFGGVFPQSTLRFAHLLERLAELMESCYPHVIFMDTDV